MASIRLNRLCKSFGQVAAVRDVSLEFEDGKMTSLLGPSGCGKTTTLNMIAGFFAPDSGSIHFGERPIADPANGIEVAPHKRELGMVFQSYALWPHLTIAENVGYGLKMRGVARAEREAAARSALARVRLEGMFARYPHELSGGQQQRVALARAIAYEPRILLFDEPLSNLDAQLREEMRVELKQIHRDIGITAIYVTHDQAEAMSLSDIIVVMVDGQILQRGTPRQLYEEPADIRVARFIGKSNLVDAVVVEQQRGLVRVKATGLDEAILCRAPEGVASRASGALSIRPEAISLKPLPAAATVPSAEVTAATYLGESCRYEVRIADQRLEVQQGGDGVFAVGDRVHVEFNPNKCYFIAEPRPSQ